MAPLHKVFGKYNSNSRNQESSNKQPGTSIQHLICHTGQHYDANMSRIFFDELEIPKPDFYLGVGSGSHAEQTAKVMIEFEKVLLAEKPDLVIVYGDVNSTAACSITAVKMGIKTAHVESGLRSFDRNMPEEINRIITDHITDYLFVTEKSGIVNLKNEGIPEEKILIVGNTMIDSLVNYLPRIEKSTILTNFDLSPFDLDSTPRNGGGYVLVTLHRPSNVDDPENVKNIISLLNEIAEIHNVVFPVHPRTRSILNSLNSAAADRLNYNLILTPPIGYIDFISLMKNAKFVITDSGGIQSHCDPFGRRNHFPKDTMYYR